MTNQIATTTPDILIAIDRALLATSTKQQYKKAITNALAAGVNIADPGELGNYAAGLKKSSRAFLKSAIRLWSEKIALDAKAGATPSNVDAVTATVYRIEALQEAIKVEPTKGSKAHAWLTQTEVKNLLLTCDTTTTIGKRDRIVLGLLLGAGLRREELSQLTYEAIERLPGRVVLNVTGKGAKDRAVPINDALANALDDWRTITGPGKIARSVTKGGELGGSLSAIGIFNIVAKAGEGIGQELAPHDCRRTFAQLGYEAGIPITQISLLLGHSSLETTRRYLNIELDLKTTVSDFIPFA